MAVFPPTASKSDAATSDEVSGIARIGRRTKHLVKRLRPGDIAIIDHRDLDRVSGEDLVACGVAGVVNCSDSSSGRYPNMGPLLVVQAGIALIDAPGADLMDSLSDGDPIVLRGGQVWRRDELMAEGERQEPERVQALTAKRRREIGDALEAFAANTVQYMIEERDLLSGKLELPVFDTDFRDRPVLIVVRGVDHKRDLKALRAYIRDVRPVLVGVDGGADAIIDEGFKPDMIVGDMDSATEPTLRAGAELVVHAYPDGRAPGRNYLESLGLDYKIVPAPGTSQDIAMLIAAEKGAELIVSVGSHFNLVEFLDKNRKGMASTFLTRLRVGEILVDAKGVSRLYRPQPGIAPVLLLAATGLVTLIVVILLTPALHDVADLLWLKLQVLLGIDA
ncbi:putative cytokinetic ring protein SteA [Conexibacter sp. JD483]|uniref:putative cytokinetic ring protein SteA n=1 Tax=unclassified Conexibacter TaxID=2627773 RepID=UPI002716CA05|nr:MULTISPECIES: putative cytokinetic ring protein SteA [unclassified Conexibacter]MDO8185082.1 putative cytokinetic ring protein SteA [Conexibacter sp. CPCC 205706]MDO8196792.1 putative cytokinetic ring protein SteA [Conexibacter sp. CPCC 205762]MDR9368040.1 putative cytokinetic ring protein SteA [Conexibacter sp. JD483]